MQRNKDCTQHAKHNNFRAPSAWTKNNCKDVITFVQAACVYMFMDWTMVKEKIADYEEYFVVLVTVMEAKYLLTWSPQYSLKVRFPLVSLTAVFVMYTTLLSNKWPLTFKPQSLPDLSQSQLWFYFSGTVLCQIAFLHAFQSQSAFYRIMFGAKLSTRKPFLYLSHNVHYFLF